MMHEISFYDSLCSTSKFVINGKDASSLDFGEQRDESPEMAEDYCCGDMRFTHKKATREILRKYSINKEEYDEICAKLEAGLSFGSCGWCS